MIAQTSKQSSFYVFDSSSLLCSKKASFTFTKLLFGIIEQMSVFQVMHFMSYYFSVNLKLVRGGRTWIYQCPSANRHLIVPQSKFAIFKSHLFIAGLVMRQELQHLLGKYVLPDFIITDVSGIMAKCLIRNIDFIHLMTKFHFSLFVGSTKR